PRQARAARREVRIEQELGTVDGAIVIELDGRLEVVQRFDRAIRRLLGYGIIEERRRILWIERLRNVVLALVPGCALFFVVGLTEVATHDGVVRIQACGDLEV